MWSVRRVGKLITIEPLDAIRKINVTGFFSFYTSEYYIDVWIGDDGLEHYRTPFRNVEAYETSGDLISFFASYFRFL